MFRFGRHTDQISLMLTTRKSPRDILHTVCRRLFPHAHTHPFRAVSWKRRCLSFFPFSLLPQQSFECVSSREREKENMKLIFPSKHLGRRKINTRFIWNETERTQMVFLLFFFRGSGVCVLRVLCDSRDSFCLYHATVGNVWPKPRSKDCQKC